MENVERSIQQAKQLGDTVKTAGDQISQAGTKIGGLQTPFSGAQTGMQKFSQEALQTQQSTFRLTGGINDMSKTLPGVNSGLSKSGTAMGELGSKAQAAQTGTRSFGTAITGLAGIMTQGVGAGIQLFNMYDSIGDAQVQVTNKSNRLSKAQEAEGKARDRLNALMKSGTATTQEIAAAQLDLEQATKAVAVRENDLENAQEALNQSMAEFAKNILPLIIQTVGGVVSSVTLLKGSFLGAGAAGVKGSEGVSFFGKAVGKLPALMGPIGIVLAGVGAAMALIGTNAFGVRDALDGLGKAIGDMFPILKPVLESIRSFGEIMGLTSVDVSGYTGNVTKAVKPTEDLGAAWKRMVEDMKTDPSPGMNTLATNLEDTGIAMKDFTQVATTEPQRWLGEVNKFFDQISKNDYSGAVNTLFSNLQKTFEANLKGFQQTGVLIGTAIKTGIYSLGKAYVDHHLWVAEQMAKGLPHVLGIGQEIGSRIIEGIGNSFAAFTTFLDQVIITPLKDIPKNVTDIGQQLYEKSGLKWFIDTVTAGLGTIQGALGLGGVPEAQAQPQEKPKAPAEKFVPTPQMPYAPTPSSFDTYAPGFGPQQQQQQIAIPGGAKGQTQVSPGIGDLLSKPGATTKEGGVEPDLLTKGTLALEQQKKQLQENLGVLLAWGIQNGVQIPKGIQNNAEAMTGYLETLKSKDDADKKNMGTMLAKNSIEADAAQAIKNKAQSETEALTASASNYVGYGNALKLTAAQQQAVVDEFQPLNEGMREENANLLAVQTGYASMSKGRLNNILNLQKERQGLELNNLLTADSNRLQIAQAQARTEGVKKGVEFVNNLMTQNAEMEGYKTALTAAIGRTKEWADGLGLTSHQLELMISKSADVKAAQDDIINSLADQVHELQVNKAAWEGLSEAQKSNIDNLLDTRQALEESRDAFAKTTENAVKLRTAFIDGIQSAKDWAEGIATARNEEAGFRSGLIQSIVQLNNTTGAFDLLAGKSEDVFNIFQGEKQVLNSTASALDILSFAAGRTNEQLQQLASVAAGVPSALRALGSEIQGLSTAFQGFLEFAGDEDEIFGNFKVSDKMPKEIKKLMDDSTIEFAAGQAQMKRVAEGFGPAIGVALHQALDTGNLSTLKEFGPKAADAIREGWNGAVPPAIEQLATDLDKFSGLGDTLTKDTAASFATMSQAVIQDINNISNPMDGLIQKLISMQGATSGTFDEMSKFDAGMATMAGGLEAASHAGETLTSKLSDLPLVKITDDAGNVTAQFANFNGQLVPIPGAVNAIAQSFNPLNSQIQLAAVALQQFQTYLTQTENVPTIALDISPLISAITVATNAINAITQTTIPNVSANISPLISASSSASNAINAIKQTSIPQVVANISPLISAVSSGQKSINSLKQTSIPKLTVDISGVIKGVNSAQSKINSLKGKNVTNTVTTRYVTAGRPRLQHGGSFVVDKTTNIAGRTLGEFNKPELVTVTPLTNPNEPSDRTISVPIPSATSANPRVSSSAGSSRGDTTIVVPVHIGNEKIDTIVKRVAGRGVGKHFR